MKERITIETLSEYGYTVLDAYMLEQPPNTNYPKDLTLNDLKMTYTNELEDLYFKLMQKPMIRIKKPLTDC